MAHKLKNGKYACGYCFEEFSDPVKADSHKESHDLVYIQLSRNDLNKLIMFIHLKQDELLTPTLVKNLRKYLKGSTT